MHIIYGTEFTLYGKRFEHMRYHPLEDAPEIVQNRELMYIELSL